MHRHPPAQQREPLPRFHHPASGGYADVGPDRYSHAHTHPHASRHELISEYESELEELTFNSKPIINNLTIIAEENIHAAEDLVKVIESRIYKVLL
jgi:pre-mRNA cleavage complex 2 protein Pcf11